MARRRSGWDEFAKGFGLGQQMVEKWNDTQLKNDLTEAGKTDEIQYDQYTPEQAAQIEANAAAGKENPYEGLSPAAKRYSFAGTDRDKAFTDIEKDGLRATQLARVYDKHGKTDLAMQMRSMGRQMEKENRELQTQRRVDDIIAKDFPSNEDELVSMAIDQWGKDMGVGGMGKNAGTTLESVPMLNGSYRVTAFDKDGNATGFKELTRQELLGKARDYLENNRLLELSRADPKNYLPLAINKAHQDRSFAFQLNESLRQQGNADRTFAEGQRQFGLTLEQRDKHHREDIGVRKDDIAERRKEREAAREAAAAKELRERLEKGGDKVQKFAMDSIPELWSTDSDGKQRVDEKASREFNDFIQRTGGIQVGDKKVPWDAAMAQAPAETKAALRNQFALYYLNSARNRATGQQHPDTDVKGVRDSRDSDWGVGQKSGLGLAAGMGKSIFGGKVIELKDGSVLDYEEMMKSTYGPMILSYLKANGLLEEEQRKPGMGAAQTRYLPLPGEMNFVR